MTSHGWPRSIWLPILAGAVLLAIGRDENARAVRWMALLAAIASFLVTIPLVSGFEVASAAMQFEEKLPWIERFKVNYHLGVDGISVWFVLLTAFITVIVVISAWEVISERVHQYMGAFLILSGLMIGVFAALDGLLFYVFFEATLIPMYLIIGVWGGPNRVYAAVGAYTISWEANNGAILYSDDYGDTWDIAPLPFKQGGNMPGRGMGERLAIARLISLVEDGGADVETWHQGRCIDRRAVHTLGNAMGLGLLVAGGYLVYREMAFLRFTGAI